MAAVTSSSSSARVAGGSARRRARTSARRSRLAAAWNWTVAPGFRTFQVHLFFVELPGAPLHAERDVHYELVGQGSGRSAHAREDGSPASLEGSNGGGCALCEDRGFPGQWSFR